MAIVLNHISKHLLFLPHFNFPFSAVHSFDRTSSSFHWRDLLIVNMSLVCWVVEDTVDNKIFSTRIISHDVGRKLSLFGMVFGACVCFIVCVKSTISVKIWDIILLMSFNFLFSLSSTSWPHFLLSWSVPCEITSRAAVYTRASQ